MDYGRLRMVTSVLWRRSCLMPALSALMVISGPCLALNRRLQIRGREAEDHRPISWDPRLRRTRDVVIGPPLETGKRAVPKRGFKEGREGVSMAGGRKQGKKPTPKPARPFAMQYALRCCGIVVLQQKRPGGVDTNIHEKWQQ
jgi:hypothetical protein